MQVKNYIIPELFIIKDLEYRIADFLPSQSLHENSAFNFKQYFFLKSTLNRIVLNRDYKVIKEALSPFLIYPKMFCQLGGICLQTDSLGKK